MLGGGQKYSFFVYSFEGLKGMGLCKIATKKKQRKLLKKRVSYNKSYILLNDTSNEVCYDITIIFDGVG